MKTLELSIRILAQVTDKEAAEFLRSPDGYLMVGETFLGDEHLSVGVINGPRLEADRLSMEVTKVMKTN